MSLLAIALAVLAIAVGASFVAACMGAEERYWVRYWDRLRKEAEDAARVPKP